MLDLRRQKYLEEEIDRLQEEKLEAIGRAKQESGIEKAEAINDFLELNARQADLERELQVLNHEED